MSQSGEVTKLLLRIQSKYPLDNNKHFILCFLADPLVEGPSRHELSKTKLSQMKAVFDKQHGEETVPLFRMLFLHSANDKESSNLLKPRDSPDILFAGKSPVKEEKREEYNLRRLLVYVANSLDDSQLSDMITLIGEEAGIDCDPKPTQLQRLLVLFERALQQGIILPQKLDKLKEWLEVFGREDLIRHVNQFEPKKQFPGAVESNPAEQPAAECSEPPHAEDKAMAIVNPFVPGGVMTTKHDALTEEQPGGVMTTKHDALTEEQPGGVMTTKHDALTEEQSGGVMTARHDALTKKQPQSFDSAYGEDDSRSRSGSTAMTDPTSLSSYADSDLSSRFRSTSFEEKGGSGGTELVSGVNKQKK